MTDVHGFLEGEDCLGPLRAIAALGAEVPRKAPGHFVIQGVGLEGLSGDAIPQQSHRRLAAAKGGQRTRGIRRRAAQLPGNGLRVLLAYPE